MGIHPRGSRRGRLRRRLCRLHQTRILKRPPAQAPDASKRIPREEIRARIWSSAGVSHLAPTFSNHSRAPRQTHKPEQKYKGGNHGRPPAQNLPVCRRRHPHRTTLRRPPLRRHTPHLVPSDSNARKQDKTRSALARKPPTQPSARTKRSCSERRVHTGGRYDQGSGRASRK